MKNDQPCDGPFPERHPPAQAAIGLFRGAAEDLREVVPGEGWENDDPHPGQEGAVQLERGVLGRRTDERGGPRLHVRQEDVLLGPVETVDLVDEEERPLPACGEALRVLEDFPDLLHPRYDGGEGEETGLRPGGDDSGECRLAGSRHIFQQHVPAAHQRREQQP